jgi:hypothetical protein
VLVQLVQAAVLDLDTPPDGRVEVHEFDLDSQDNG